MLDSCVNQFSFRCDDLSKERIKISTESVRKLAVSVCGEMTPEEPLSTCLEPLEADACSEDSARDCSFNEVSDALCTVSDDESHCR